MITQKSETSPRIIPLFILLLLGGIACSLSDQFVSIVTATPQAISTPNALESPPGSPTEVTDSALVIPTQGQTSSPIEHLIMPADPGDAVSTIDDRSSQTDQGAGDAVAESWRSNILERPFQRQSMIYLPHVDLDRAAISLTDQWLYVELKVHGMPPPEADDWYGLELDLDIDGRGDLLLAASSPSTLQWTTEGVVVWRDANRDVGGPNASRADGPSVSGDGYESSIFEAGLGADPDLAWSRLNLDDSTIVEIALKRSALDGQDRFAWRPFVDGDLQDPGLFDYHDHFSLEQAGSPLIDSGNYPLKDFGSFDNSCAWAVGFTPTGNEPGMCLPPATSTPTASATPEPGAIYGLVWWDEDRDRAKDSGEPPESNLTINLGGGPCPSSGLAATTTSYISYTANFRFDQLAPGTYCVSFNHVAEITTYNNPATIQVPAAGEAVVNFGLYLN